MTKTKTVYVCQQCGAEFPKWMGKCSECMAWNSVVETTREDRKSGSVSLENLRFEPLSKIKLAKQHRISTGVSEVDRVLGGGIVAGSVILLAGEPGIGKSTLMLQLAQKCQKTVCYVSGEESPSQIKIRAQRLGIEGDKLLLLPETNIDRVIASLERQQGEVVIVDSIQTIFTTRLDSVAGSVGQVRESASAIIRFAKSQGKPIFLIGHITKEGAIAGPKVLEHMVDVVVYFEGDKFSSLRLLRSSKNRFGATDEVGIFEMTDGGLEQVTNPSRYFLKEREKKVPGSVVTATMEGTRPLLAEIQALCVPTQLAIPRRISQGFDYNRLQLIVAVLSKKLGLPLAGFDVYANIAGGLRIQEPAADLGVAMAVLSSFKNLPVDPKTVCYGELGLLGEIRDVGFRDQREKEAKRLGFLKVISPKTCGSINQVVKEIFK